MLLAFWYHTKSEASTPIKHGTLPRDGVGLGPKDVTQPYFRMLRDKTLLHIQEMNIWTKYLRRMMWWTQYVIEEKEN